MTIENITHPKQEPKDGDLLKHIYTDGSWVMSRFYTPKEQSLDEKEGAERQWRDSELKSTDWIVSVTDHPQHASYLVYRQELRDYPQQSDFPNGDRPIRP